MRAFIVSLLISALSLFVPAYAKSKYEIIIDAGSSGSRLQLFEYDSEKKIPDVQRILSKKKTPGLSSFVNEPKAVTSTLKPLLDEAVHVLNTKSIDPKTVNIQILATAGMRLLTENQQQEIYTQVRDFLKKNYTFPVGEIKTISGQMEGVYGWLSANYLEGTFQKRAQTFGNIDLGGASTQIVFSSQDTNLSNDKVSVLIDQELYSVFSKSFLGLGMDQARNSMLQHPKAIHCYPKDYLMEDGRVGSFNMDECRGVYSDILEKKAVKEQVKISDGTNFFANSAIHYAYDFFNKAGSFGSFEKKIQEVCSKNWADLEAEHKGNPFLSKVCSNGAYVYELLYRAYQLREANVRITDKVNGQEIDWSLGALLHQKFVLDNNSIPAPIFLNKGFYPLFKDSDLGNPSSDLIFNGGVLGSMDSFSTHRNMVFNSNGIFYTLDNLNLNGVLTGRGGLVKIGPAMLILGGDNDYTGHTLLAEGKLSVHKDSNLGARQSRLIFDGGTLVNTAQFSTDRKIALLKNGGTFETLGDLTLNGIIEGEGGLIKTGPEKLILTGKNTYIGDTSIKQGTLLVNGSIQSNTMVGSNGLLAGNGTIFGNVHNMGILSPGNSIGVLTIDGNYVGNGGKLIIESILTNDQSPSDKLVIKGHASGDTLVEIINLSGLGGQTLGDGIEIIKTGSSTPDAFSLISPVKVGAFTYNLYLGGINHTNSTNWYLRSSLRPAAQLYPIAPFLLQEYAANILGDLHQRTGAQKQSKAEKIGEGDTWVQFMSTTGRLNTLEALNYDLQALKVGKELYQTTHDDESHDHLGIYVAFGKGKSKLKAKDKSIGNQNTDASSLGAYWTHYGTQGQYLDTVLQATHYHNTLNAFLENDKLKFNTKGYTASVEAGYPLIWKHLKVEPQAQIIYQSLRLGTHKDKTSKITFNDGNSLRARMGLRFPYEGNIACGKEKNCLFKVALTGNIWREFLAKNKTTFYTLQGTHPQSFAPRLGGTWAEVGVEGTIQISNRVDFYVNSNYSKGLDGVGRQALGGNVGVRIYW